MSKKSVNLSHELNLLLDGVRGLHALTRRSIESYGTGPDMSENLASLLVLLGERIRLLDRVVRGAVDPEQLRCSENDAALPGDPAEDSLVLAQWSEKRLLRHHRAGLRRAKARLKATREAKR